MILIFQLAATNIRNEGSLMKMELTEIPDELDIECINFDNFEPIPKQSRAKKSLNYLRSAVSSAAVSRSIEYNRVSNMDVSSNGTTHVLNLDDRCDADGGECGGVGDGASDAEIKYAELSPIHHQQALGEGYRSIQMITAKVREAVVDALSSDNQSATTITASPLHGVQSCEVDESAPPVPQHCNNDNLNNIYLSMDDEQEMARERIKLAANTPWREFLTNPIALCLFAANFQYVRLLYVIFTV